MRRALFRDGGGRYSDSPPRRGGPGWDEVEAYMPQSELQDLIIELRSQTMGLGTYVWKFDHMAELTGRLAETVVQQRREAKK